MPDVTPIRRHGCSLATYRDLVSAQEMEDWCRENIAVYKVPRMVQFVDALPKSGAGKVMWRTLQEMEGHHV